MCQYHPLRYKVDYDYKPDGGTSTCGHCDGNGVGRFVADLARVVGSARARDHGCSDIELIEQGIDESMANKQCICESQA